MLVVAMMQVSPHRTLSFVCRTVAILAGGEHLVEDVACRGDTVPTVVTTDPHHLVFVFVFKCQRRSPVARITVNASSW